MKMKRPLPTLNISFIKMFCYGVLAGGFMEVSMRAFMGFEGYMTHVLEDRGDPWHWLFYVILVTLCIGLAIKEAREHRERKDED